MASRRDLELLEKMKAGFRAHNAYMDGTQVVRRRLTRAQGALFTPALEAAAAAGDDSAESSASRPQAVNGGDRLRVVDPFVPNPAPRRDT